MSYSFDKFFSKDTHTYGELNAAADAALAWREDDEYRHLLTCALYDGITDMLIAQEDGIRDHYILSQSKALSAYNELR